MKNLRASIFGSVRLLFIVPVLLIASLASAQMPERGEEPAGTEPTARFTPALTEIVVTGRAGLGASFETRQTIGLEQIKRVGATTVADALRLVPAAHIQTNSRGESLIFLRNAGERQVAVFFDGALLNIPWDNRVDLSLVPANILGGVTASKGATSVQYGANVIGGAVNLTSREPGDRPEFEFGLRRGGQELWDAAGTASGAIGKLRILGTAGYSDRRGVPLPGNPDLPFNQIGDDVRTNTDAERFNALIRGEIFIDGGSEIALSLLYLNSKKGVAPEGHIDPEVGRVRYWRYPDWQNLMAILNGRFSLDSDTLFKGSAWVQEFDQTIDSFASITFRDREERQRDDNLTVGGRFTLQHDISPDETLLFSFNGLVATHRQRTIEFDASSATQFQPRQSFRQRTLSFGGEYGAAITSDFDIEMGAGIDWMAALKTGDKPAIDDFLDFTLTGAGIWQAGAGWRLRVAVGRKTRFPTMRELFGEAINRFLINPQLQPESAWVGELGAAWTGAAADLEMVAFASFTDDTIDRRNITVDGRRLRQRINLRGSRIIGLEAIGSVDLNDRLAISGHVTIMDIRRRPDGQDRMTKLAEKPRVIGRAALEYSDPDGLSAAVELVHRGRAFSQDEDNRFVPLEVSTVVNLKVGLALTRIVPAAPEGEVFLRIDNATDAVVEPQLGLPASGRWVSGGVRARF